jgi:hypothetical protein
MLTQKFAGSRRRHYNGKSAALAYVIMLRRTSIFRRGWIMILVGLPLQALLPLGLFA